MMKGSRNKFKKYKKSQDTNKKGKEVKQKEKGKYFIYACVQIKNIKRKGKDCRKRIKE